MNDVTGERQVPPCEWFAACENQAVTMRDHPILGQVPICGRCSDKVDALEREVR